MSQMAELVPDDVIADERRHLNEAPVQGDDPARRAGSPPRAVIAHRHAVDREASRGREGQTARRQLLVGEFAKPGLDGAADTGGRIRDRKPLVAASDMRALPREGYPVAAIPNHGAGIPRAGLRALATALANNPINLA